MNATIIPYCDEATANRKFKKNLVNDVNICSYKYIPTSLFQSDRFTQCSLIYSKNGKFVLKKVVIKDTNDATKIPRKSELSVFWKLNAYLN